MRGSQSIRGWGHQSATPTPPPRSPVPTEDAGDLSGRVRSPIGNPNPKSTSDRQLRVLGQFGVGVADRGCRGPPWVPATSVERSGRRLATPPPFLSIFFIELK
ncbi:hypothetical protein CRG98_032804 [Punica granatum]|uniref:Uncharacterized protein n=1 Tax=Punica granatum TaxID=22663 RepID=A0A2I0IS33_PUNGR|nr:hypothetical protein CRG98_032804 [Punica granatum]